MGAVLRSKEDLGGPDFALVIEIRTALPASPSVESFAEVGQELRVLPEYAKGPDGAVDPGNPRNAKLEGLRALDIGNPLLVEIRLGTDGRWYIVETVGGM